MNDSFISLSRAVPCRSQELLPFLSVMYFSLPHFSTNYSSILSHLILPSISWSASQSCCSQIHIQYPFGNQRIKPQASKQMLFLKDTKFLAILRCFFHSSPLCTFSCHPSPPTVLPSSLTSSCHLFLGLPLNVIVPKFIYNTLHGILFSSILCTCPNQRNLFNESSPI